LLALSAALLLLAVGPGATAGTSTPPRNGLIAVFQGDDRLQLVDPAAGSMSRVPGAEWAIDAAWSPDGARLAATLWDEETPGVYTMKPDGSDRVLVTHGGSAPTWSPDGKWLAIVRDGEEGSGLAVVSLDGQTERELVPATGDLLAAPAWSPNGDLIAFVDADGGIQLVTPDGKSRDRFDVGAEWTTLSWSPDASRIAFESVRGAKGNTRDAVVVLDLATGKETVLAGEQDGAQAPAWSPDGDQIAFLSQKLRPTSATTSSHSCGGEPYDTRLWSMRPDGTKARQLVDAEVYGRPSWGRAVEAAPATAPASDAR
jgi:Tol biopolymer transport system component